MNNKDQHVVQQVVREWLGFPESFHASPDAMYHAAFDDFMEMVGGIVPQNGAAPTEGMIPESIQYDKFSPGVTRKTLRH